MANHGNLLLINVNCLTNQKAFEKASEGHNVFGCAVIQKGQLISWQQEEAVAWETFEEMQQKFKSVSRICYFGRHEQGSNKEDVQPYLVKDKDGTHMAFFAVGDYPNVAVPKSTRPPEHRLFRQKFVGGVFQEYLKKSKEPSMDGFLGSLKDPTTEKMMLNLSSSFGVSMLMASTGEVFVWPQSEHYAKFDWGHMADANGYEEKVYPEAENALGSFFSKPSKKAEKPAAKAEEPKPKAETVIHNPPVESKKQETATTADKFVVPEGKVMARPSGTLKHDKQIQKWYQTFYNPNLIVGWKDRPWVPVDVDKAAADANTEIQNLTAMESAIKQAQQKKIEAEEIAARHVPDKMKKDFQAKFIESKRVKELKGHTKESIEAEEKRFATFFDHTKLQLEDTLKWGEDELRLLDKEYHQILLSYVRALRNFHLKYCLEHPKQDAKAPVVEKGEETFFTKGKKAA